MMEAPRPLAISRRLLAWALPPDRRDDIAGDLEEVFAELSGTEGAAAAKLWHLRESLLLALRFSVERLRDRAVRRPPVEQETAARSRRPRFRLGLGISLIDIKLGIRMLFKSPGLTLVSTAALAIAIAIVAGFHTATNFMVRPKLPLPDGDRVVAIWQHDTVSGDISVQTFGDMLTWQRELETLEDVGAFRLQERAIVVNGATRLVRTAELTPSVFDLVRIPPLLGRPLVDTDAQPGGTAVAVIGYDFWQTVLAANPTIVGETIRIGGLVHTIVGVMPEGFGFPQRESIWLPLPDAGASAAPDAGPTIDFTVARLGPGVSLDEVDAELQLAGVQLAADFPESHGRLRPRLSRYAISFIESGEPGLAVLMHAARIAIGIVLLLVAVNVGTLVYARNAARVGEVAVRMALGASRRRVVLQMFIEAVVLSSLAALCGVAILLWPLSRFREVFDAAIAQGDGLPYWFEVGIGGNTVLLVIGLTILSAVLTGALPALKLTSSHMQTRLQRLQQGGSGLKFGRTTTLVVVSQVALSVALMAVGGAQLRTFIEDSWSREDLGGARDQLLTAQLRWDSESAGDEAEDPRELLARAEKRRELGRRAETELEVLGATFESYQGIRFFVPDLPVDPGSATPLRYTHTSAVAPNFFDVRGAPIEAGRALREGDRLEGAASVAVVNQAFVDATRLPGDPIGQRVRQYDPRTRQVGGEWLRIVGVVRDSPALEISQRGPEWIARPTVYLPLTDSAAAVRMLVRARGQPERLVGELQALAAEVDPSLVLHRAQTFAEADRFGLTMAGLYGIAVGSFVFAALLLSTTGVYAMMSFTTTQRTREIGIRSALGAPAGRVIGAVFARALKQLGAGLALGLILGFVAADGPLALSGGLFADGPGVIVGVVALILIMGLIACGRPIRRALRIEPTEALRVDA